MKRRISALHTNWKANLSKARHSDTLGDSDLAVEEEEEEEEQGKREEEQGKREEEQDKEGSGTSEEEKHGVESDSPVDESSEGDDLLWEQLFGRSGSEGSSDDTDSASWDFGPDEWPTKNETMTYQIDLLMSLISHPFPARTDCSDCTNRPSHQETSTAQSLFG
jgi:hypothetical protein